MFIMGTTNYYCKYHEPLTPHDVSREGLDWDSVVIEKIDGEEVSILVNVEGIRKVKKT